METEFTIRQISGEDTIALRWPILRAGLQRHEAIFSGDDLPETRHFGAYRAEELVGVVTILPAPMPERPDAVNAWQLRGMATAPQVRGAGCGRRLLEAGAAYVKQNGPGLLWCNARVPAQGFYSRHGWIALEDVFDIPTAGPHVRMFLPFD